MMFVPTTGVTGATVCLIFFLSIQYGGTQIQFRGCKTNEKCILLTKCPFLLRKVHSGDPGARQQARDKACSFQNRRLLVCCPTAVTTPSPPTTNENVTNPGGEELLPRRCGNPSTDDRIHGGLPAPLGAYPWMVAIGYQVGRDPTIDYACAGSVINEHYVLTAAHCVHPDDIRGRTLAVLNIGDWDLSNPSVDCQITLIGPKCASTPHILAGYEDIIIHENYNKRFETSDDIALIRLDRKLSFNTATIQPICLPPIGLDPRSVAKERRPVAAGWGFTEKGKKSDILLRVDLPFADFDLCKRLYKDRFTSTQICAGGEKGFDSCGGDSGGPLVLAGPSGPPFLQVGIVSFGPSICALDRFPAIYTSVSKYRTWIVNNLRP